MKLNKLFLTILLLLASFQIGFGQEKPNAVLVDKFSFAGDCSVKFKIDDFALKSQAIGAKMLVIIYGSEKYQVEKYTYEQWIRGFFKFRGIPDEIVAFAFGEDKEDFAVEFWTIPKEAKFPQFVSSPKDYKLKNTNKMDLHFNNGGEGDYPQVNLELFANFLKANPNLNGKILIYGRKPKLIPQATAEFLKELTNKYKISRSRIRLFYSYQKTYFPYENFEFITKNKSC